MTSKLSLHDFIGMIIPGCFWVLIYITWKKPDLHNPSVYVQSFAFLSIGYIVGILWHMVIEHVSKPFLTISLRAFYGLSIIKERDYWNIDGDNLNEQFFYAYEFVQQNSKSEAYKFVEGQVLFLRNFSLPLALWLNFYLGINHSLLFVSLLCGLSILFMFIRQLTVYRLIFEEFNYLKKLNHDDKFLADKD